VKQNLRVEIVSMENLQTRLLHSDRIPKPFNSHILPIFQISNFDFDPEDLKKRPVKIPQFLYSRSNNPNVLNLEQLIANLEVF
jgi:cystathionine beta-lyase/cystathionine gamma-synthase